MAKKIIAVVGATNSPGRGLVRAILDDKAGRFGARVITLDINTAPAAALAALGAEVVVGHPGAAVGLKAAFAGAYGAFYFRPILNPPPLQKELAEVTAMGQAAKDAGLEHLIWATLGDAKSEIAAVFKTLGVPTTLLHTFGNLAALRREAGGEELGRLAYGIFRSGEYIGQTVPISADLLVVGKRNTTRDPVSPPPAGPVSAPGTPEAVQRSPSSSLSAAGAGRAPPPAAAGTTVPTQAAWASVAGAAAGFPRPRSRGIRAWIVIPAIAAIAVFGVAYLRKSWFHDGESPAIAKLETSPAPVRTRPIVDPLEERGPATPTVTSRWERERAATRAAAAASASASASGSTGNSRKIAAPPIAPPSSSPKHVRQKKRDRQHSRDDAGDDPPSTPSESPAPPEPTVAARAEAPAGEGAARSAAAASGTARPPRAAPQESPAQPAAPPGSITAKAVAATVREHASEVRACFDRAVMERSDLHGRLSIRATVDPMGQVVSVSPISTIEAGGRLEACVVSAFRTWTFPKPAGGIKGDITYSFSFE